MSIEDYIEKINDLREWFKNEIKSFPVLEMSRAEYSGGVDNLPENYGQLRDCAFNIWLNERHYELSYNQMCQAFFLAANDLGLLKVEASITQRAADGGKPIELREDDDSCQCLMCGDLHRLR